MLEAERAGAKALVVYMDDFPHEESAVREFDAASPRVGEAKVQRMFEEMKQRHLRSISACEGVVRLCASRSPRATRRRPRGPFAGPSHPAREVPHAT